MKSEINFHLFFNPIGNLTFPFAKSASYLVDHFDFYFNYSFSCLASFFLVFSYYFLIVLSYSYSFATAYSIYLAFSDLLSLLALLLLKIFNC